MSVSLYRKYRPVRFEDVVGQEHITRTLVNAIKHGRTSHAYLFAGPRGTGKTSTAKILAMAMNCETGGGEATVQPDGTCPRCRAIRGGSSLDVLEMDAASNRGIDEIRGLRDEVHFAPVEGRMKVYIVDEVHMLTPEAFNALLKMLEEPPPHVIFVLATTEPHKVLPTILSRCQRFDFRRPTLQQITDVLKKVAHSESIEVTENTLSVIARSAAGSFRDAIGTLDQLTAYCEGSISLQDALAVLGVSEHDLLFEIVDTVEAHDTQAALLFVERLSQAGTDVNQFVRDLLGHLRDLYVVQHTVDPPAGIGTTEEHIEGLRSQANRVAAADLVRFIDLLGEAQRAMRQGGDPRLELELVLMKMTRPETDTSIRGLTARIEKLEQGADVPAGRAALHHSTPRHTHGETPRAEAVSRSVGPEGGAGEEAAGLEREEAPADAEPTPTDAGPAAPAQIEGGFDSLRRAWPVILNAVKKKRIGLHAVLSEGRPDALEEDVLIVRFAPGMEFQASQVNHPDNAEVLRDTLSSLTGKKLRVEARIGASDEAYEAEEEEGSKVVQREELFHLLREEFNARPVDGETNG